MLKRPWWWESQLFVRVLYHKVYFLYMSWSSMTRAIIGLLWLVSMINLTMINDIAQLKCGRLRVREKIKLQQEYCKNRSQDVRSCQPTLGEEGGWDFNFFHNASNYILSYSVAFLSGVDSRKMERVQERALRAVYCDMRSSYDELLRKAKLTTLGCRRLQDIAIIMYKAKYNICPP